MKKLIFVALTLASLMVAALFYFNDAVDACLDKGGRWREEAKICDFGAH